MTHAPKLVASSQPCGRYHCTPLNAAKTESPTKCQLVGFPLQEQQLQWHPYNEQYVLIIP